MALISNDLLTFADWNSRRDPDGGHASVAEVMSRRDEAFQDVLFMEANQETSHRDTLRSSLPAGEFRAYNEGVSRVKSTTKQIVDDIANLQAYGVVDKDMADLSNDKQQFRFREEKGVMQGLTQQYMDTLWYGNRVTSPKEFTGFSNRYNDITDDRVIDKGDSGSALSSIWFIVWGDDSARAIYPKGMSESAGLDVTDLGEDTVLDANGKEYQAYRTHYRMMAGLSIKDYRQVVRICNIDTSAVISSGNSGALINPMIDALSWIEDPTNLKIYMNRQTMSLYQKLARSDNNAFLTLDTVDGRQMLGFQGYPFRRSDSLIVGETQLV